jgi:lipopolysaccharide export system permease protein
MNVFSRYVFRQASNAVIMILSTLIIIIWVSVALKQIDLMTNEGQSAWMFFYITILALPQIIGVVMPVALLIACVHTLNKASGDSEIIVMTASGAGRWQLAAPLFTLAFIVMLLVIANNAVVQPAALRELRMYTMKVRTDLISHVLQPGKFTSAMNGMTFHIRARDENGDILGFLLQDSRNPDEQMSYMASRSRLIEKDGLNYMVMYDGHIFRRPKGSHEPQVIKFDNYVFDLSQFEPEGDKKLDFKTYESYIGELISPDPNNSFYKTRPGTFRAELHDRLSNPLFPVLFVMIAMASLGYARTTRENRLTSIATAFVLAAVARLGGLSAVNMLAKSPSAVYLVWGIPLGGMLIAAYVIQYRGIDGVFSRRRKPASPAAQVGGV